MEDSGFSTRQAQPGASGRGALPTPPKVVFRGVIFTFVDHDAQEFVRLGGAGWLTQRTARREFDALPEEAGGDYLADYWADDYHVDEKHVSVQTIEAKMGEPITELLARGRAELAGEKAEIRSHFDGASSRPLAPSSDAQRLTTKTPPKDSQDD